VIGGKNIFVLNDAIDRVTAGGTMISLTASGMLLDESGAAATE
jgi:hypothetical protein